MAAQFSDKSPRVERVKHPIVFSAEDKKSGVDLHAIDYQHRQTYSARRAEKEAHYKQVRESLMAETLWGRMVLGARGLRQRLGRAA